MNVEHLVNELTTITTDNLNAVELFKTLDVKVLNFKPAPDSWSILECIEHLNRYGRFYIPEIQQCLEYSKHPSSPIFKSGLLGNYFAKSMLPKDNLNTMKTFKSMNPNHSRLNIHALDEFITQQHQLIDLLNRAKTTNLSKVKTAISISKWIKLRLGDTFRVVIYHNFRHILQAKKAQALSYLSLKEETPVL